MELWQCPFSVLIIVVFEALEKLSEYLHKLKSEISAQSPKPTYSDNSKSGENHVPESAHKNVE